MHTLLGVAPVIRLKEISGNAGLNSFRASFENPRTVSLAQGLRKAPPTFRGFSITAFLAWGDKNHTRKLSGD